ncbi:hypothetical protein [Allokutzneria albata]|uniref:Uncharacterized protein n=1 Tax=Allokutzneria albata TaxID=211114 RepID=A0A1G9YSL5_ALLAB|nr:hypothetical protein [Allokutzneria albata]SDN11927.1 hypothetical protein SAMN04489726_5014 [Allokutzneria albata]
MIVWTGWGILTILIAAIGGAGGSGIGVALGGPSDSANLGTVIGLLLAGVAIWFVGERLNRPVQGFDQATGQPVLYRNRHRLFWVPMQYFGPIVGLAALGVGVGMLF